MAGFLGTALLRAACSGCVDAPSPLALETERPDSTVYVGTGAAIVNGEMVPVDGGMLKMYDDGTYLAKTPGSNVWLGGRWHRNASMYCAVPAVFDSETLAHRNCSAFFEVSTGRLQDPTSIFLWDGASRYWDPVLTADRR
jgi:hypothetical protein